MSSLSQNMMASLASVQRHLNFSFQRSCIHKNPTSSPHDRKESLNERSAVGRFLGKRNKWRNDRLAIFSSISSQSVPSPEKEESEEGIVSEKRTPRICILGGGFGGLYTAVKLDNLLWPRGLKPEVTLVDQNDRFVFKPLLYEILTGEAEETEVAPLFRDLLEPFQTRFLQGRVDAIHSSDTGGTVMLSDGSNVRYDWLVIAMGAKANFRGIPGVVQHSIPFNSYEDVQKIIEKLDSLGQIKDRAATAVVIGGGYAGVELAASLATRMKNKSSFKVTLVTDTNVVLPAAPASQRQAAIDQLLKCGTEIKTGYFVKSIEEKEGLKKIALAPASNSQRSTVKLETDLALWTAGNMPSTAVENGDTFPFARTSFGALKAVDWCSKEPSLRLVNQRRVFALGDDAYIEDPTKPGSVPMYPATAQVAFQQADYVAWNLWAAINKRSLLKFRYQHLGDMMSLGSTNAAIALPFSMPSGIGDVIKATPLSQVAKLFGIGFGSEGNNEKMDGRPTLEGPLASIARRLAYWYRQPTNEHKAKIAQLYFEKIYKSIASGKNTD